MLEGSGWSLLNNGWRGPWLPRGRGRKGCERVRRVAGMVPARPPPQGARWSVCRSASLLDIIQYLLSSQAKSCSSAFRTFLGCSPPLLPSVSTGFEPDTGAPFIRRPPSCTPVCTCCFFPLLRKLFPSPSYLAGILVLTAPPPGRLPDPPHGGQHSSMMRRQFLFQWPCPLSKLSASRWGYCWGGAEEPQRGAFHSLSPQP